MFSIHDKVCWIEMTVNAGFIADCDSTPNHATTTKVVTGIIVDELDNDRYLVKRDDTGKCEELCYRKLRKTNG